MSIQPRNNNLNYLIDPAFTNFNRFFVLSFPRNNNTDSRYSFSNYYVPKVKVNDFNVLIDGKSFFDLSVKNDEEAYEKIIDMSIIGKLLRNTGATMFFIIEKSEETTFNFSQNSVTIV